MTEQIIFLGAFVYTLGFLTQNQFFKVILLTPQAGI